MIRTTFRTSAKHRRCDCGTHILPGDQYLEHVISPDHGEVGNVGWWRASGSGAGGVRRFRWRRESVIAAWSVCGVIWGWPVLIVSAVVIISLLLYGRQIRAQEEARRG